MYPLYEKILSPQTQLRYIILRTNKHYSSNGILKAVIKHKHPKDEIKQKKEG